MSDEPRDTHDQPIGDEHDLIREQYQQGQADSREHAIVSLAAGAGSKQPAAPLLPHPAGSPEEASDQFEAVQQLDRAHGRDTSEES